ncbi:hypothetical protein INR15_27525, partial [Klebsiella pneumoniae]|uniref:hypothetical protein n=1 Tax=Klebsiella pneumoniae TaxID=573 RepID=UPI001E561C88
HRRVAHRLHHQFGIARARVIHQPRQALLPAQTILEAHRARGGKSTYYRLETFLLEGSQGNDLMDYSKEQVITDILDQYERHL